MIEKPILIFPVLIILFLQVVYALICLVPAQELTMELFVTVLVNSISAFAALLAALVALYFGTQAQRKSDKQEKANASVAAAKLIGRVERIGHQLEWTIQAVLYKGSLNGRFRYLLMGVKSESLSERELNFTNEELMAIHPLGNSCAQNLALCATEISRIRVSLMHYEEIYKDFDNDERKEELVKEWMDGIQSTSKKLRGIYKVLHEASGVSFIESE
tara:strand:- start:1020 stop:1670 length:651 start_codon:yes stop_codon:yes gene_type:complete